MAKIAVVNIDMHGHVNPTLGLVTQLAAAGHQVYFFGSEEFRDTVEPTRARFIAYPSHIGKAIATTAQVQALADAAGIAPPPEVATMKRALDEFTATFGTLDRELRAIKPDVIVYDFVSLATQIIADSLGIPAIKFYTTYASNEHYDLMAQSFAKRDQPSPESLLQAQALIDEQCAAHGHRSPSLAQMMHRTAAHNLVFLPRALQPMGETFDSRFHFVGPCFQPVKDPNVARLIPPGTGPVLLVSLGSLFHEWPEFYQNCIQAFGDSDWRVVMSIGRKLRPESLGKIPSNVAIYPHIPQVPLLAHADVFISHGGMNSTMEAMSFGVPLVVIPQIEEQAITARQVAAMGLGIHLTRSEVSANSLEAAVGAVHDTPTIQANVEKMADAIREAGGPRKALDIIQSLIGSETDTLSTRTITPPAERR